MPYSPVICSAETEEQMDPAAKPTILTTLRPPGDQGPARLHALQPAGGDGMRGLRGPPPVDGRGPRPAPQEAEGRRAAAPEAPSFAERSGAQEAKDQSKWRRGRAPAPQRAAAQGARGRKSAARGLLRRAPELFRTLHVLSTSTR